VRRSLAVIAVVVLALVALALILAAYGGGDGEEAPTSPVPRDGAAPPAAPGSLPPEFVKCMADQGFKIESPADIHAAPSQVLQACFGALHQGGTGP
jgi:hypothetical protein